MDRASFLRSGRILEIPLIPMSYVDDCVPGSKPRAAFSAFPVTRFGRAVSIFGRVHPARARAPPFARFGRRTAPPGFVAEPAPDFFPGFPGGMQISSRDGSSAAGPVTGVTEKSRQATILLPG